MDILSSGQTLAQLRNMRGISQAELARRTSIPAYRLSRIEHDHAQPSPAEVRTLARYLNDEQQRLLRAFEPKHPRQGALLAKFRTKPAKVNLGSSVTFESWRRRFGVLAQKLESTVAKRNDAGLCRKYLRECGAESLDELQLNVLLLSRADVVPTWTTPARCGFTTHPAVERESGCCAHGMLRPALFLNQIADGLQLLLFPQVSLRARKGQFRLDFLVGMWRRGGVIWLDLEVDGRGHDPGYDEYRRESLGLPTARLSGEEVARWDSFEILTRRLRSAS